MGMFDTFLDNNATVICPACGEKHNMQKGVQSKQFQNILDYYYVGDMVDDTENISVIEDWDWCHVCNEQITLFFSFKNSIFLGIFQTEISAKFANDNANIYELYKKLFNQKTEISTRVKTLESKIRETIYVHGEIQKKKNFQMFHFNHNRFIDFDIIKTLKNILIDDE
jgi:hypothetical protein